ncbi:BnaC08g13650D, partial [Brassica napus]
SEETQFCVSSEFPRKFLGIFRGFHFPSECSSEYRCFLVVTGAFDQLKLAMTTVPVLAMPDFEALFEVESDASSIGLGAVLMQRGRPLAFFSQALTERQKLKSVYERELMAIVFAVQKWRHYLTGRRFVVSSDQKSLKFLLEQREINMEYQRWLTKLLGFDFTIQYRPGLENKAADALSRQEGKPELAAMTGPVAIQLEEINGEVDKDPDLQKLIAEWQQDPASHPEYKMANGRLLRHGKLVIPKKSPMIGLILQEIHDRKTGGHGGVLKTQRRAAEMFYWSGMMTDVRRYVSSCQALGVPVHRLVEAADSVSVCLSKGLGAPVGTVFVGSHTFIEKAKTLRKTLGGGMRQIGVLCAAALVALQENLPKLQFDHNKAKLLAEGLNQMTGIRINVAAVETNMIFMDMEDGSKLTAEKLRKSLTECGILVLPGNSSRYVSHEHSLVVFFF